jgi:hypothetical protein
MNAKKCKALRKLARERTVGMPARRYVIHRGGKCLINAPESTRGEYRSLKKIAHTITFSKAKP